MSREHHKNLQRGIKQPLVSVNVPFRRERHGKPVSIRKRHVVEENGVVKVKYSTEPVTPDTIRTARVSASSTGTYGQPNSGGAKAGKKAPKKEGI